MTGKNQLIAILLNALQLFSVYAATREPWVKSVGGFFDEEDCVKLIEASEAFDFPLSPDSIDYNDPKAAVSWAIDVFVEGELRAPSIAALYDKYLPKLRDFVAEQKIELNGDYSEPVLDWVFVRKFAADGQRQMLKLHVDTNLFTVNIALNDEFDGGGFFYYKPDDSHYTDGDPRPILKPEQMSYDFLEHIKRQNTSVIVFPEAKTGSLLAYNYTLFHAIAPIEKGTRYSLVFFYDMHHPDVERFYPKEFDAIVNNDFDFPIDLQFVDFNAVGRNVRLIMEDIDEREFTFRARSGVRYEVVNSKTGEIVQTFRVPVENVDGEAYHVHLRSQEGDDVPGPLSGHDVKAIIINHFPYAVSLVWRKEVHNDEPLRIVVDDLPDELDMDTSDGHQFEVVKRGTNEVVDYFQIKKADDGLEVVVIVGPFERTPSQGIYATLANGFPYPVSLYWVKHEDDGQTRQLVVESLSAVYEFQTTIGDEFLVVTLDGGEVVDSFEIPGGDADREVSISVGPSVNKIPNKERTNDASQVDSLSETNEEL